MKGLSEQGKEVETACQMQYFLCLKLVNKSHVHFLAIIGSIPW